jgi:hypothetical protein
VARLQEHCVGAVLWLGAARCTFAAPYLYSPQPVHSSRRNGCWPPVSSALAAPPACAVQHFGMFWAQFVASGAGLHLSCWWVGLRQAVHVIGRGGRCGSCGLDHGAEVGWMTLLLLPIIIMVGRLWVQQKLHVCSAAAVPGHAVVALRRMPSQQEAVMCRFTECQRTAAAR